MASNLWPIYNPDAEIAMQLRKGSFDRLLLGRTH